MMTRTELASSTTLTPAHPPWVTASWPPVAVNLQEMAELPAMFGSAMMPGPVYGRGPAMDPFQEARKLKTLMASMLQPQHPEPPEIVAFNRDWLDNHPISTMDLYRIPPFLLEPPPMTGTAVRMQAQWPGPILI